MNILGKKLAILLLPIAILTFTTFPTRAVNHSEGVGASSESILLTSTLDTMIASGIPNVGFEGSDKLKIGYDQTTGIWKALVAYDLSSIPVGSTIQSAYFRVYPAQNSPAMNISVYRLSKSWYGGISYIGDPYNPGDPKLNFYFPASTGIQNFNITSFVQEWVNDPSTNFGIEVIGPTSGFTTTREFYSNNDPYAREPELYVSYTLPVKTWTLMYYLAEDNNLSQNALFQIPQLRKATANNNINITVFYDGANTGDTVYLGLASNIGDDNKINVGELSTGDPDTLSTFIEWSQSEYPAENYALILYDHSSGVTGFGFDNNPASDNTDCSEGACLTFREIQQALNPFPKLDIIYIDACSSGTFEVAYELRDQADYMVASQQTVWGPHSHAGSLLAINPTTTPVQLSESLASNYYDTFVGKWPGTISVVDLTMTSSVKVAIDNLASSLSADMQSNHADITAILSDVQRHETNPDYVIDADDEFVDLYHFSLLVNQRVDDVETQNYATAVIATLNQYIVWNRAWSGTFSLPFKLSQNINQCIAPFECTWDLDNSYGVSIFFPNYSRSFYKDGWLDFSAGTIWNITQLSDVQKVEGTVLPGWGPMLVEYVRNANPTEPDNPSPPALQSPISSLTHIYLPLTQK